MARIYWEDFKVGDVINMGSHTFTEAEIIEFAQRYDPQPFHIDPVAARDSIYGGLIASGWHICSVCMRHMVDAYVNDTVSMGSPGLDNIRWMKPVRPGDTLSFRRTITAARPSNSRPGAGLMRALWEAVNQDGEVVMSSDGWGLFGRRPQASPD